MFFFYLQTWFDLIKTARQGAQAILSGTRNSPLTDLHLRVITVVGPGQTFNIAAKPAAQERQNSVDLKETLTVPDKQSENNPEQQSFEMKNPTNAKPIQVVKPLVRENGTADFLILH